MQIVYFLPLLLGVIILLLLFYRSRHKKTTKRNNAAIKIEWSNDKLFTSAAEFLKEGLTMKLTLRGYSMRPFLEDGRDVGVLAGVNPQEVKVGDVVLAEFMPKRYALHRVIRIEGDEFDMLGDGNLTPEHCKLEDIRAIALGFYRKGRKEMDSVEGRKWKMYSAVWMTLRPIRRYLLFIYRRYMKVKKIISGSSTNR